MKILHYILVSIDDHLKLQNLSFACHLQSSTLAVFVFNLHHTQILFTRISDANSLSRIRSLSNMQHKVKWAHNYHHLLQPIPTNLYTNASMIWFPSFTNPELAVLDTSPQIVIAIFLNNLFE